jgi:hypothetical protein
MKSSPNPSESIHQKSGSRLEIKAGLRENEAVRTGSEGTNNRGEHP